MKNEHQYLIKIICVGLLTLIVLAIPIHFLSNLYFYPFFYFLWPPEFEHNNHITPSGLTNQWDMNIDANSLNPADTFTLSYAHIYFSGNILAGTLGIYQERWVDSPTNITPGPENNSTWTSPYFDQDRQVLTYSRLVRHGDDWHKSKSVYAGPEGCSENYDVSLGKFDAGLLMTPTKDDQHMIVLDKSKRRFYQIDFENKQVSAGKELSKKTSENILQIGFIHKEKSGFHTFWTPPRVRKVNKNDEVQKEAITGFSIYHNDPFFTVLKKDGQIDLYDTQKLEWIKTVASLPNPTAGHFQPAQPEDVYGYSATPCYYENQYLGAVVGSCSRDLQTMALTIFDAHGKATRYKQLRIRPEEMPGGVAMIIGKYLVENLHPPLFALASYNTADRFDAMAGHRAMFFQPNSFVAMFARDNNETFLVRWLFVLLTIAPSILLGLVLALRVVRNAKIVGLDNQTRRWWLIATILFGLSAYITYRITKPKMVLVTCENCGKLRRPDFDTCHHCQSKWNLPELQPPSWSVRTAL